MKNILVDSLYIMLIALVLDVIIVIMAIISMATGEGINHLPFWDAQIRFFISLIS